MAGRDDASQGPDAQTELPPLHVQGDELRALLAASDRHGVAPVDLTTLRFSLADLDLLPLEIARRHKVLPLLAKAEMLFVAMANPSDAKVREELEFVCGRKLLPFVADPDRLAQLIDVAYDARARGEAHLFGDNVQTRVMPPPALPGSAAPSPPRGAMAVPSRSRTILTHTVPPPRTGGSSGRHPKVPSSPKVPGLGRPAPPAATVPPAPLAPAAPVVSAPTPPPALSLGTRAVWIVSANAATRASLAQAFGNLGHAATTFETARAFRAAVDDVPPDVVFFDPALPDEDGHEVLKALRAAPRTAKLPVVVVSPAPASWRRDRDLRAVLGVAGTLSLPAPEHDLLARFESALNPSPVFASTRPLSPVAEAALQLSTQAYQRGEVDVAIQQLQRGLDADPQAYRLHYQVALLHGRQGSVHAAITALERSVALFDGFFPALKNLAVLYERVGFKWSAADTWERALSVAPDEATRAQIKDHLGLVAPTPRS
jgi:DNA-binding response OmpR family regulator